MRIHYYMQYFPGAEAVGSQQPITLAGFLARRGHEVTVFSCDLNLDTGLKERSHSESMENGGSLRIIRIPAPEGGRRSNIERLKAYVLFMFSVKRAGMMAQAPDVILGSIQPLFTGWAAMRVAKKKRVPFMLEVRDLWPDALVVKKAVNPWLAKPLFRMADSLYAGAVKIVSLTPGIKKELVAKGIPSGKISVFPNGFDPSFFELQKGRRDSVRSEYGWNDDFVAIYTGSFTQVTAVDVIVRAAGVLRDRSNIRFELFGKGPTRDAVAGLAEQLGLKNIRFHEPVPKCEVPGLLAAADVALMCLFETPLAHIYFENKFLDYMGAGKPIIAAMEGEQADIIKRHGTGQVVSTYDHEGLARAVMEATGNFAPFAEMGENGRRLVHEQFLLPSIIENYAKAIERVPLNHVARPF
jgi:glycosyltransferase involved in cell wall biosynthesis